MIHLKRLFAGLCFIALILGIGGAIVALVLHFPRTIIGGFLLIVLTAFTYEIGADIL